MVTKANETEMSRSAQMRRPRQRRPAAMALIAFDVAMNRQRCRSSGRVSVRHQRRMFPADVGSTDGNVRRNRRQAKAAPCGRSMSAPKLTAASDRRDRAGRNRLSATPRPFAYVGIGVRRFRRSRYGPCGGNAAGWCPSELSTISANAASGQSCRRTAVRRQLPAL